MFVCVKGIKIKYKKRAPEGGGEQLDGCLAVMLRLVGCFSSYVAIGWLFHLSEENYQTETRGGVITRYR